MSATDILWLRVSFGVELWARKLEARPIGQLLTRIQRGKWKRAVMAVRRRYGTDRKDAKKQLPVIIWAGRFKKRKAVGLIEHSGVYAVDLDDIKPEQQCEILGIAQDDPYCLAAWRSCSGSGMWMLFRIRPCSAEQHSNIFEQVAKHVRRTYGVKPDEACKDVCRACHVSDDPEIWINRAAEALPIRIPRLGATPKKKKSPSTVPEIDLEQEWEDNEHSWRVRQLGKECVPRRPKGDGSNFFYTHDVLKKLARRSASYAFKLMKKPDEETLKQIVHDAYLGWWMNVSRRRMIRGHRYEYWTEFVKLFYGAFQSAGMKKAASTWTRWKEHPKFPQDGTSRDKLKFCIRRHCGKTGKHTFFLSTYDAGPVCGISNVAAWKNIKTLIKEGFIGVSPTARWMRRKRQAQVYEFPPRTKPRKVNT